MCDWAANTDNRLLECIKRSSKPTVKEEMAGIRLEIWVPFSESLIVKLKCVLKKVIKIGRVWRTCQIGNKGKDGRFLSWRRQVSA